MCEIALYITRYQINPNFPIKKSEIFANESEFDKASKLENMLGTKHVD